MTTKNSFSLQTIKDPTPQQLNVFNWITNSRGSLELVARAGCGKTTTLMGAIEIIYQQKLGDVAIMAYNKAIAEELKQRLVKMEIDWKLVTAGTVHSFGFSTWRQVVKNVKVDPVRDKPRRSGRGRIARTAQPSLSLGFSVGFAAARCTGERWKSARRRSLKRNRTATTARLSSSASGCRAVPSAAGDWRRL